MTATGMKCILSRTFNHKHRVQERCDRLTTPLVYPDALDLFNDVLNALQLHLVYYSPNIPNWQEPDET